MCEVVMRLILSLLLTLSLDSFVYAKDESSKEASEKILKDSLFNIDTKWKDQNNQNFSFKDLNGKKTIVAMVYTKCAHTCPLTIHKLEEIKKHIKSEDYIILLASFDFKGDRPEVLKKYMKQHGLDEKQWKFISADDDSSVRELAVLLGVNYKKLSANNYSHSNIITALSKEGVIIAKLLGLDAEMTDFVQKLDE